MAMLREGTNDIVALLQKNFGYKCWGRDNPKKRFDFVKGQNNQEGGDWDDSR